MRVNASGANTTFSTSSTAPSVVSDVSRFAEILGQSMSAYVNATTSTRANAQSNVANPAQIGSGTSMAEPAAATISFASVAGSFLNTRGLSLAEVMQFEHEAYLRHLWGANVSPAAAVADVDAIIETLDKQDPNMAVIGTTWDQTMHAAGTAISPAK